MKYVKKIKNKNSAYCVFFRFVRLSKNYLCNLVLNYQIKFINIKNYIRFCNYSVYWFYNAVLIYMCICASAHDE